MLISGRIGSVDPTLALNLGTELPHLPLVRGDVGIELVAFGGGLLVRGRRPLGGSIANRRPL